MRTALIAIAAVCTTAVYASPTYHRQRSLAFDEDQDDNYTPFPYEDEEQQQQPPPHHRQPSGSRRDSPEYQRLKNQRHEQQYLEEEKEEEKIADQHSPDKSPSSKYPQHHQSSPSSPSKHHRQPSQNGEVEAENRGKVRDFDATPQDKPVDLANSQPEPPKDHTTVAEEENTTVDTAPAKTNSSTHQKHNQIPVVQQDEEPITAAPKKSSPATEDTTSVPQKPTTTKKQPVAVDEELFTDGKQHPEEFEVEEPGKKTSDTAEKPAAEEPQSSTSSGKKPSGTTQNPTVEEPAADKDVEEPAADKDLEEPTADKATDGKKTTALDSSKTGEADTKESDDSIFSVKGLLDRISKTCKASVGSVVKLLAQGGLDDIKAICTGEKAAEGGAATEK